MDEAGEKSGRRLGFALGCGLLVAAAGAVFGEWIGTHRLPIHIFAVAAAALSYLAFRPREGALRSLGLANVRGWRWTPVLLAAGAATGVLRYLVWRATGLGGVRLYEQEFVGLLDVGSGPGLVASGCVFLLGSYAAVLVPSVLFFGVIQTPFARAGLFPVGLLFQALVFGLVHCFMAERFDPVYGVEAFAGAVVSGMAFSWWNNVYVPAAFMAASVFTATVLAALGPTG